MFMHEGKTYVQIKGETYNGQPFRYEARNVEIDDKKEWVTFERIKKNGDVEYYSIPTENVAYIVEGVHEKEKQI